MRFLRVVLIVLGFVSVAVAQNREQDRALLVGFSSEINLDLNGSFKEQIVRQKPDLLELLEEFDGELEMSLPIDAEMFNTILENIRARKGDSKSLEQLIRVGKIVVDPSKVDLLEKRLNALPYVNYVDFQYLNPIKPPFDIPPVTPFFEAIQNHLYENPGVDIVYAWNKGYAGQGIKMRDVEYGFNPNHEELHVKNVFYEQGKTIPTWVTAEFSEHGTATIGVINAHKGDYGVSGMAHQVDEVVLFAEGTNEGGLNRNAAVLRAIEFSNPGDIILYEMQTYGVNATDSDEKFVPAEFDQTLWNLTKMATQQGIFIIAAAGNGGQDLDGVAYEEYRNRGDSGAILVGAGSPNTAHERLGFSTYGSKVHVQGWGSNVLTAGYGNYAQIGGDFNQNYTRFSGTSSATPIVASVIAVLQSFHLDRTGTYLSKDAMLDLIIRTGYPQGGVTNGHIGPLPNTKAALDELLGDDNLSNTVFDVNKEIKIYPNPTAGMITISTDSDSDLYQYSLFSSIGKVLLQGSFNGSKSIDLSSYSSGVYYLKLNSSDGTSSYKIVRE